MRYREHLSNLQLAMRVSVAAVLALAVAELLKLESPIFVFMAAVIVTDLSPQLSRQLGTRRIVATIVGTVVGALLTRAETSPVLIGGGVLIAMLICQMLRMGEGGKIAGFICGLILIGHEGDAWPYAIERCLETMLGVLVAWAISYVPKLIQFSENRE